MGNLVSPWNAVFRQYGCAFKLLLKYASKRSMINPIKMKITGIPDIISSFNKLINLSFELLLERTNSFEYNK